MSAGAQHSTYVQMRPDGFFASCRTCGSDSFPDRKLFTLAEADAEAHGFLIHVYDRERLIQHEARIFVAAGVNPP